MAVGDHVAKISGDYRFVGVVVAAFGKLGGSRRYVVENSDGVLHIFSGKQLAEGEIAAGLPGHCRSPWSARFRHAKRFLSAVTFSPSG